MNESIDLRIGAIDDQQFNDFLVGHPELANETTQEDEAAQDFDAPFYMGHILTQRAGVGHEKWATPKQTLTTGGWKYDGDVED